MKKFVYILVIVGILAGYQNLRADEKSEKSKVKSTKIIDIDSDKEKRIKSEIASNLEDVVTSKGLSDIAKKIKNIAFEIKALFWDELCKIVSIKLEGNKLDIHLRITIPEKPRELTKEEREKLEDQYTYYIDKAKEVKKKLIKSKKKKKSKRRSKSKRRRKSRRNR